ncbi:MAG: glycosyl hydrolase [Bacteroidota bacterium]|nr:glycosyl hydrolase [Bacteroidota bacterium]
MRKICYFTTAFLLAFSVMTENAYAGKKKNDKENNDTIKSSALSGLKFRSIGPAFASGRIADFAVNPCNTSEYYVAVASGNVWKTSNNGTTFSPVFDNYGSYSIGCVEIDPNNQHVVWIGTGENNHQRALGYGDGVYKSIDGGKSFKNVGLKDSRQIGMIAIDPRDSDVVYVAAEGSVWGPGGDRGLYKTTDGGKTWNKVLEISENTGVNNVIMDPRNPDIMYATSEQRRRHVFTKIGGGPESGIRKSTDGGENWRELKSGLPGGDVGGIGIAISPVNPDYVYAIIEAAGKSGGFFRSTDRGESWKKMSGHHASGQYYNEIYCDPKDVDKVYSMETVSKVTTDGGKSWENLGLSDRHVDDHALWINPVNTDHFVIGGDGGVYETFDAGKHYFHKSNLPVTQFYRVNVDNSEPFYWVYGGTQDNNSMGGPSQNLSRQGVASGEWITTLGGDGFWQAIDPENPDIVYSEYQYGNVYRYDKQSGEALKIKPGPRKGEKTYKWNWNTPFIISPHSNTRLYIAANKVFRSDDRGHSWEVISEDITTQTDRNTWPVMGQYWSIDAVAKDVSTSLWGTSVSIAESPVKEDLLYVGTDDGVIAITEDAGENWHKEMKFPDVPEYTYVSDILPGRFDENVVYASFDNRKRDDFKPYILKSTNKGKSWESIAGNLPENGTVHAIAQDFENKELLFVGTEFGIFFSIDGGKIWTQLKSGIPTIAVRDIALQERESDLVLATFGRGFYIMDNYSPLREISPEFLEKEAYIFPVEDAMMFIQQRGKYGQGADFYTADNPDFGATFTYYVEEKPKTLKQIRQEKEKELIKEKEPIPMPSTKELRAEESEIKPHFIFVISDVDGNEVRRITTGSKKGINRINWDLRYSGTGPVSVSDNKYNPTKDAGGSLLAMPGKYHVSMLQYVRGDVDTLAGPVVFEAKVLENTTLPAADRSQMLAFQDKATELYKAMRGAQEFTEDMNERLQYIKQAIQNTPGASMELMAKAEKTQEAIDDIMWEFNGQKPKASREEIPPAEQTLNQRLNDMVWGHWGSTAGITATEKQQYEILSEEFPPVLEDIKKVYKENILELEKALDEMNAPWTPGRIPDWEKK